MHDVEQARAHADEAQAGAYQGEPERPLQKRDRVALVEQRGERMVVVNLGQVVRVSKSGYVHVEWDDHDEGYFSPLKVASSLRLAEGEDALPRHVWSFSPPASVDEPVCSVCKAAQTDANEFGPCK